ncbi:MAG TPA: 4-hydroxythreonine-4-phosphate dehydrogenase PdxA [Synergistales bacterium]|nr:4-hydroxythreonine-4-phosphate dehydrogenase PdxA [Synergistales bacterium]MDI9391799.1 4-hydroxythreonine-4-phosphate dehydrogenase PdxA [Synergistota bacterium]MDY0178956.1 4-hydroxythreonine-4-phosphate dehydrogenase PdxA [Synergistaceae bacterium]HRW86838.1 4-hydroxythreonine-4-phosphate dehydrogenase PdxA [Thermovirgaceae bacterium]MDD3133023.1 4-hydroxythreonine-4-phosphate dehydrogenase PdxA [Synergistales bacterium]
MSIPCIAVTMGDPAGVGPEVVIRGLSRERVWKECHYMVVGDIQVLRAVRDRMVPGLELRTIDPYRDRIEGDHTSLPVMDIGMLTSPEEIEVGQISSLSGRLAVESIVRSVELAAGGVAKGVVTAPINKESVRKAGFDYIGHTEMFSEMTKSRESVTMFLVDNLKIFFHSRHQSVKDMINGLSVDGIVRSIRLADKSLKSIGIENGRMALAALNPHGSDGGLFGDEEHRFLIPGIQQATREGILVSGPVPADSVFHMALSGVYDAVVSLYHDQGHIAAKTYDFYRTVSVTLGLPFIRTSVDHGTAFDIAWKGIANPVSMEEALAACGTLSSKYQPAYFTDPPYKR